MKKIFWKGTEHWDQLLIERAAISGRLVLSDFTRNAIENFKKKCKPGIMKQAQLVFMKIIFIHFAIIFQGKIKTLKI